MKTIFTSMWPANFFEWLNAPDSDVFKSNHDENIRTFLELMKVESWFSIQQMPYVFFLDFLKWKIDLEERRNKEIETRNREQENAYRNKMNIQKAEQRKMRDAERRRNISTGKRR